MKLLTDAASVDTRERSSPNSHVCPPVALGMIALAFVVFAIFAAAPDAAPASASPATSSSPCTP